MSLLRSWLLRVTLFSSSTNMLLLRSLEAVSNGGFRVNSVLYRIQKFYSSFSNCSRISSVRPFRAASSLALISNSSNSASFLLFAIISICFSKLFSSNLFFAGERFFQSSAVDLSKLMYTY